MSFNFMATITICSDFGAKEKYPWGEKMAKWLSEETLQIAMKRREAKGKEQGPHAGLTLNAPQEWPRGGGIVDGTGDTGRRVVCGVATIIPP